MIRFSSHILPLNKIFSNKPKFVKVAQTEEAYDYKSEGLYQRLSEKGQQYIDQKNAENPITDYFELDKIVERAVVGGLGDMMFPSKSEEMKKDYMNTDPDVFEMIAGLWLVNRGLYKDKQFQGFVSPPFLKALMSKLDPKFMAIGDTGVFRINPNSPYQKLWKKIVKLMTSVSPYFEDYGADEQLDIALFNIVRDIDNPDRGFREEADNIIAEAKRLHDELKSDPASMPDL